MTIPNTITLVRVLLIPVIFWFLVSGRMQAAFVLFAIAGLTDLVDGWLAKRWNMATELGAYLDPIADKLLVTSIYIALGVAGELPSWLVIMVVSRDILIVVGVILCWVIDKPVAIKPHLISKLNTAFQLVLAAVVLADTGFGLGLGYVRFALIWLTAALTLVSLALYLRTWLLHVASTATTR